MLLLLLLLVVVVVVVVVVFRKQWPIYTLSCGRQACSSEPHDWRCRWLGMIHHLVVLLAILFYFYVWPLLQE